jgi:hypothetical protein
MSFLRISSNLTIDSLINDHRTKIGAQLKKLKKLLSKRTFKIEI